MKTLITGANGLLGANLARELLNRGHAVRALVRSNSDLRALHGLDLELHFGDLQDELGLRKALRGCDSLVHAAGRTPDPAASYGDYIATNLRGTQKLVRAAEEQGMNRMVHVSSCCVFGGGSLDDPGTELSEFNGFRFNSGYINSKYLAQQWILSEVEKKGLPIVVVNPTIMLGPFDTRPSSGEIILRLLRKKFQVCPTGGKNFIDVRDAARATCNALLRGIPGECYLLAGENLTFSALFRKIYSAWGICRKEFKVPGPLVKLAGMCGNILSMVSEKPCPLTYSAARQLSSSSYFSGEKAVHHLQLTAHGVDDAIRDAIAWFSDNGYLNTGHQKANILQTAA